jgi:tetratricopeptide (TPR) repeat protein
MRATLSDVGVADKPAVREAGWVLELADDAVRLASADARAARRLAEEALAAADDAETRSTAERALGLAAVELGDAAAAVEHFRRAIAIAEAARLRRRAAEARMSLALALTLTGASAEALAEADRAEPDLEGPARARLQGQRAVILQKLGRLDEALEGYRRPLAAFRRAGDVLWEARLLCNRGVLQVYRGAVGPAESDFLRAETLHESIGQALAATQVRHNLGWVAARRGDVPAALDWYDRVEAEYRAHGVPLALLLMDRCEVLLSARLAAEARENAEAAVAELDAAGLDADLAEARLLAAHADLLAGDAAAARDQADRADAAFTRQHRPAWAALARAAAARAAWLEAERTAPEGTGAAAGSGAAESGDAAAASGAVAGDARRARLEAALGAAQRALRTLDGVEALDARLIAGRAAIELGRPRLGRRQLELAATARHRGPVQVRTRAWHAAALERLARGDRRGANAAIAAGLRALEAHRMTLGATELRAHASGHGEELAMLGLRLAVESGSAERVLAGAERLRAAGLLRRAARPPDDEDLAADLIELRRVTAALDESLREGRPDHDLLHRQAALEASVRRRARRARGHGAASEGTEERVPTVSDLGGRSLVDFVALDGRLLAVTVVGGRARLRELGDAAAIEREVESLRMSLRSLATAPAGSRAAAAMGDVCDTIARKLDALLFAPLELGDAPLVLVPTGALHALPWSMLPSLEHRPLSVAPSLKLWHRTVNTSPPKTRQQVLVAGPRLPAATQEIETLAQRHPEARTLTGEQATIQNVARALDCAASVHVAAHGRFRVDNPQFTSLELADGRVTVYDLERLSNVPNRIVLSSCESGLSAVSAGDELMGFTAAVIALGTQTVIAAVVPVPDETTKGLMLALDDELSRDTSPAQALVNARDAIPKDDRRHAVARAAFVCFGAG